MGEHTTLLHLLGIDSPKELYWFSILLFLGTYAMIILEKFFHRVPAALLGGSLAIFLGVVTPKQAWESVDHNTIFLLIGMMVIVSVLIESGFFSILSNWALRVTRGDPIKILIVFTLLTAFLSAFLDNVTTVLFMVPILLQMLVKLKINPIPYVIATVLASNIGGTATLIGDPPNIIIGSLGKFTFNDFIVNLTPIVIITHIFGTITFVLYMKWKGYLEKKITDEGQLAKIIESQKAEYDISLMRKGLTVFGITLLLFFFHHLIGLEPGTVALTMASVLLLWTKLNPEKVFERVEWGTLMFFLGLFIVIGGLEVTGVFEDLAHFVAGIVKDALSGIWIIGVLSAFISGIVDNIPFTMAMSYVLLDLQQTVPFNVEPLWWALALGACLGGNITVIGASANVVAAGLVEKEGYKIGFFDFIKMGTPVAVVTVFIALFLLWLKYLIFGV
ncbi:MAG: arsenic transporter [Gammaproteobacteria bacterium]|nr:MAG: arsenic transporter [Gammaproteobacteria bacterium]RTZ69964.1 MAG: arsenic transporter [Aquificaceae bacterium]